MLNFTNQEFESFSIVDKEKLVLQEGTFLLRLQTIDGVIFLYSLGAKYVEIYYSKKTHEMETVIMLGEDALKKYLDRINE